MRHSEEFHCDGEGMSLACCLDLHQEDRLLRLEEVSDVVLCDSDRFNVELVTVAIVELEARKRVQVLPHALNDDVIAVLTVIFASLSHLGQELHKQRVALLSDLEPVGSEYIVELDVDLNTGQHLAELICA